MSASRFVILFASTALASSAIAQATYDAPGPAAYSTSTYSTDRSVTQPTDPPSRVARLAFTRGAVSFAPAGENDWVEAQLNRPLVTGDKLWTDAGGRAELDIGASTVRVDQRTSFDFLNLGDQLAQMELTQGTLDLAVRRVHNGETYEVDTPTLAFVADRVGDYRIDVDAQANTTTVTARRGGGEIYGEGGTRVSIGEGQALTFDNPQLRDYRTVRVAERGDDFDGFVSTRDQRYERSTARNYVSEDVVGYEDLDDNGRWSDVPEYGHVWYPNDVAADWAPYHDGHWAWVEPWGWTWVDDASWGFAPFHYGRWVYAESRWGWVPGPLDVRPVYAPALVAFVGGDFGVNVSVGGPIGWFALGPRDVYFPGYRCGRDYFASINLSNARVNYATVNNYYGGFSRGSVNYAQINYANRNRPGALAAMPASAFASGRPVATSDLTMNSRAALANARVMPRAAIAPTRNSVLAANGRAARGTPPAGVLNRQVVAARTPPAAPASFAQRQHLLQRTPGQPLTTTQLRGLAAQQHPQRDARVRAVANVRTAAPSTPRAMARSAPVQSDNRAMVRAPAAGTLRAGERGVVDANRRGPTATARGQLRSADYAHAQGRGVPPRSQGRILQRGAMPAARTPGNERNLAVQREAMRSSGFARGRDMSARDNRGSARAAQAARYERPARHASPSGAEHRVVVSPQRQPQIERATSSRTRAVAMPQRASAPQRENRTEQAVAPRAQTRALAMPQQRERSAPQYARPIERSAPARQENRMATRAAAPAYQRAERMAPAQPAARAEVRAAPSTRFNGAAPTAPPRNLPPQPQRVASSQRENRQPPANAKKDKNDRGRD